MTGIATRATGQLRPHPLNAIIYGPEPPDRQLRESIAQDGIITPLVIDQDDTILSGHRRWRAAQQLGLALVPVVVRELADPLDGERILIESNRQREKTPAQRQREADELIRIIGAQSKERMRAGVTSDGAGGRGRKKTLPPSGQEGLAGEWHTAPTDAIGRYDAAPEPTPRGETTERVAEVLGVGHRTFQRERAVYQTATGQRETPPEVREVAQQQWSKLNAGETTPKAADRAVRAAMQAPERERARQDADEQTHLVMGADEAVNDGNLAKLTLLRELGPAVRSLLLFKEDEVCAAFERHPHMDHILTDLHRVRRWAANIERRCSVLVGGKAGQGVG